MPSRPNPYPGPRSFQRGERLYGRGRETAALLDLLIAERIVLLYSPSGAGKTSLLHAGLAPALEAEGFRVRPTMRVNATVPGDAAAGAANRYALSCLLSLEEALPEAEQLPLEELAGLSLDRYLALRAGPAPDDAGWHGDVLIFDQFEEVLTLDPTDREGKAAFFEQVGQALRDRNRWAVFSMREEFIAGLDPYLKPIPTRFDKGRRFRLELLSPETAVQAMQQPAHQAGVRFLDEAAGRLVDDLRAVRVQQTDGSTRSVPGDTVEPVQLQVVCWRLWERLAPDDNTIDVGDVAALGDVDAALRSYYADTVAAVAKDSGIGERAVRDWVEQRLITGQEIRGQVLQGIDSSDGLPNAAIWRLVDAHLLRAEQRRGATWFELAHDRLVKPVQADNAAWREATLSRVQRAALAWQRAGKPAGSDLLLRGRDLADGRRWAAGHADQLSQLDREFLAASEDLDRKQGMRRRLIGVGALAAVLLALALAMSAKLVIDANATQRQDSARALAAQARNLQFSQPELSLLLSVEALQIARQDDHQIDGALLAVLDDNPQLERVAPASSQAIQAMAIDPGRRLLAAGDDAGQIVLWNLDKARELAASPLPAGPAGITDLAMAPDRPLLAAADKRGGVTLWDLAAVTQLKRDAEDTAGRQPEAIAFLTPQPKPAPPPHQTTPAHTNQVNSVAFSPDGAAVATTGRSEVRVWTVDGLALVDPVTVESGQPTRSALFSPDGATLAVGHDDGSTTLHSLFTGETQTLRGEEGIVSTLAWSPDGRMLASGVNVRGEDHLIGVVQIWDLLAGMAEQTSQAQPAVLRQTLRNHNDEVESVAFSPDGEVLASASRDSTIYLWNVADGVPQGEPLRGHLDWVNDLAFDPASGALFSAGSRGEIDQWLLERRTRLGQPLTGHSGQVWSVAFSPDSALLASGSRDGTVRLWDVATQTSQELDARSEAVTAVAFSPDGDRLASGGLDGEIHVLDPQSAAMIARLPGRNWITALAFSPDRNAPLLAAADADNQVLLWDFSATPAVSSTLTASLASRVTSLVFDPQGKMLYGGDARGTIYQWDVARGQMVNRFDRRYSGNEQADLPLMGLAIDATGKTLAMASADNAVYLRRTPGLRPAGGSVLAGHSRPASAVAFHTDGELLASASHDGTIILWDMKTQQQIGSPLRGHTGPVNAVAFSRDGQWLASAGDDTSVILWPMTPTAWMDIACRIVGRPLSDAEIEQFLDGKAAQPCVQ
jgi:WD40 repeat protein